MYESFYGLKEKPFTLLPDPDYLYLSPKHQRALTLLEYGMMNQAGFSVICGDTGAGKTTLIRRLLTELGDDTRVGLITNTHHSFGELLNWVLMAFGLDGDGKNKAQMHQMFIAFLIEQYALNKHMVLIVDEAQNMSADTLEELRMLSNINADKDQVLQVILAGQPALRETLRKPELMQFAQRIAVDYYLESLSAEETEGYIHHRLKVAGAEKPVFTDDACKAIYKYSRGTPRLINLLCDTSLVYGFAEQSETIGEQLVHDVVREQHSNSIIPTFNTDMIDSKTSQSQNQSNKTTVEKAIEKKSAQENKVSAAIEPAVKKTEKINVVAEQTQQASVANGLEKSVTVGRVESKSGVEKTINLRVSAETSKEKLESVKEDTNVTPIKIQSTDVEPTANKEKAIQNKALEKTSPAAVETNVSVEIKKNTDEKNKVEETVVQPQANTNENSAANVNEASM
ncbi:General secretion pathway protein A, partial [hydrothermal vent metagenome]